MNTIKIGPSSSDYFAPGHLTVKKSGENSKYGRQTYIIVNIGRNNEVCVLKLQVDI